MLNRRPKAADTEDDLMQAQSSFLSSGERPAASFKRKMEDEPRGVASVGAKDVVRIDIEGKPQVKKSKFREEREHSRRKDMHITEVLADIQEKGLGQSPMATRYAARDGFPAVAELDMGLLARMPSSGGNSTKKKKSLFARQFEDKDMSFFGINSEPLTGIGKSSISQKDCVEPILIGEDGRKEPEQEVMEMESSGVEEAEYDSTAAETWDRFKTSLITGEGLVSAGGSEDTVKSDIGKIHHENVERLSRLSATEILQEKEQIEMALGPDLLAFLKKSGQKQTTSSIGGGASLEGKKIGPEVRERGAEICGRAEVQERREETQGKAEVQERAEVQGRVEVKAKLEGKEVVVPPGGWLHMDVLEKEKLEWMTDVPLVTSSKTELEKAESRFSLDGLVIPRSTDIPSHLGLHHHGDEPQAAGYTLGELIPLCRSAVLQQKVLSLQTLAKIIRRAKRREYEGLVSGSVMEGLCEAGVPLLLRFALDEGTEAVVLAAVQAVHVLLVVPLDQAFLDEYSVCYSGEHLPALRPHTLPIPKGRRGEGEGEEEEESDAQVLQRDIIEGFLKMSFLPRVRYILEVFLASGHVSVHIQLLEILTRVARHSIGAATQVLSCPRLMAVVFEQYLPLTWSEPAEDGRTRPQVAAMCLIKALCTAGRNISSQLISRHNLISVITCYTVLHPTELNLPLEEAYHLATTSLNTWQVLMRYVLGDKVFRDTFPVFLKQLQLLPSASGLSGLECSRIAALLGLMESAICLGAVTPDLLRLGSGETLPAPAVSWTHAAGMLPPLIHTLITWTKRYVTTAPNMDTVQSMGSLLNTVATYYRKLKQQVESGNPVAVLDQVERIVADVVSVLPQSPFFAVALDALREGSILDNQSSLSVDASPSSLPSHFTPPVAAVPALYKAGRGEQSSSDHTPSLQPHLVYMRCTNLVLGFVRLCVSCAQLHKGMLGPVTNWMFASNPYKEYLRRATGKGEISLVRYLAVEVVHCSLKLFVAWGETCQSTSIDEELISLFRSVLFQLFASLPCGAGHIAQDLLSNLLFHPIFYRNSIMNDAYLTSLERMLGSSSTNPLSCKSLLLSARSLLVPEDWVFSPIALEYDKILTRKSTNAAAPNESHIQQSLSYLLLLEGLHPQALSNLTLATKIARLMCVFLIDEVFFDPPIRTLLKDLLDLYCNEKMQLSLDFSVPIPGLKSFRNLYTSLLEQFCAVSYGDYLFSCFILLPLQQRLPIAFRRLVWEENPQVMRVLSLPLEQLPLDVKHFLYPAETDEGMVETYLSCLAAGTVRKKWSPLLYLVAIHHVQSFAKERETLHRSILQIKDEEVKRDLLEYQVEL